MKTSELDPRIVERVDAVWTQLEETIDSAVEQMAMDVNKLSSHGDLGPNNTALSETMEFAREAMRRTREQLYDTSWEVCTHPRQFMKRVAETLKTKAQDVMREIAAEERPVHALTRDAFRGFDIDAYVEQTNREAANITAMSDKGEAAFLDAFEAGDMGKQEKY